MRGTTAWLPGDRGRDGYVPAPRAWQALGQQTRPFRPRPSWHARSAGRAFRDVLQHTLFDSRGSLVGLRDGLADGSHVAAERFARLRLGLEPDPEGLRVCPELVAGRHRETGPLVDALEVHRAIGDREDGASRRTLGPGACVLLVTAGLDVVVHQEDGLGGGLVLEAAEEPNRRRSVCGSLVDTWETGPGRIETDPQRPQRPRRRG